MNSAERITSRSNPLVARVKRLRDKRSARREEGVFLGEGPKLLAEALQWGAPLETVICAAGTDLPVLPEEVRLVEVPEQLLDVMADTKTPQGVLFLARQNSTPLPEHPEGCRYLILDGVQDPGNVGTIWRTADAFCADGLILCNGCADPWSPKTVRSTMGAAFRLPVYEETLESAAGKLAGAGIPLYATALGLVCSDVRQADFSRCAVVIGSEGRGISQQALELCSVRLRIPMSPRCESLNAASAATVVLWEMNRDRL